MNGLHNMYGQQYPGLDARSAMDGYATSEGMEGLNSTAMENVNSMGSGQSQTLDQIVNANTQEIMRRRQTYQPNFRQNSQHEPPRRSSMLEFSSSNNSDLADFQFDPNPQHGSMSNQSGNMGTSQRPLDARRVRSREDLSLDTRFSQMPNFDGSAMSAYPNMMPNSSGSLDSTSAFLSQNMDMSGDFNPMNSSLSSMGMPTSSVSQSMQTPSPASANFPMQFSAQGHDPSGGSMSPQNLQMMRMAQNSPSNASTPQRFMGKSQQQIRRNPVMPSPLSMSTSGPSGPLGNTMPSPTHAQQPRSRRTSMDVQFANNQTNGAPTTTHQFGQYVTMTTGNEVGNEPIQMPPQPLQSRYANAYSTTGFDMLGVLVRTRKTF